MKKLIVLSALAMMTYSTSVCYAVLPHAGPEEGPINLTNVGFSKKMIKTTLGEMAVFEAGQGEPILLLHGVGAGASSFLWFTIGPELAKQYRVIAPDFIGWGESYHPAKDLLFNDYVQQIKELGNWIGEPVTIVAQSLTCGFALSAIEEDGIAVKKIALFTPSGGLDFGVDAFGKEVTANFKRIADSPQREQFYVRGFHQKPAVENWWRTEGFLDGKAVPEEIIESNFYNARQPNASYSALPVLSGTLRYDIAPLLQNANVPAIMAWGAGEFRIRPEVRERISALNPKIEVVEIANARTAFEVEQPKDTVEKLLTFFKT